MRRVILGIGNPLRRDDGVGLWVAEQMRGSDWEVIPAGQSAENALGIVSRLAPDLLVVVDAAEMGLPPGSVRRLPVEDAQRMLGSTHALPLPFLLSTVRDRVEETVLIGIQPADRSLGEGLTPEGKRGAEDLVALLRKGRLHEITPLAPVDENSVSSPKNLPQEGRDIHTRGCTQPHAHALSGQKRCFIRPP